MAPLRGLVMVLSEGCVRHRPPHSFQAGLGHICWSKQPLLLMYKISCSTATVCKPFTQRQVLQKRCLAHTHTHTDTQTKQNTYCFDLKRMRDPIVRNNHVFQRISNISKSVFFLITFPHQVFQEISNMFRSGRSGSIKPFRMRVF